MPGRPIPAVLPDLPARAQGEVTPTLRAKSGLRYQTMVLGRDDGDTTDIEADCEALLAEEHIQSYVVRPRSDGGGFYVAVLLSRAQALRFAQTNQGYRLLERGHGRAMVRADLPDWAKRNTRPEHLFCGIDMPEDDEA